jgi:hypothetical protein
VLSKIDRVLGNDLWEDKFPSTLVQLLVEGEYDHSPMLVTFSCGGGVFQKAIQVL